MVNQSLIHLKIEYNEAVDSKRKLLSLEKNSLKIAQFIENYKNLRVQELNAKSKLFIKTNALLNDLKKLKNILPKAGIPKFLREDEEPRERKRVKEKKYNPDIQSQLKEIQDKLNELGR